MKNKLNIQLIIILLTFFCTNSKAQKNVNAANFVRAETHRHFKAKVDRGYFGKFEHSRKVTPIDNQFIPRMNRDTRYSSGIFDLDEPLTIIKPNTGKRFQSMTIINEDHLIKKTIYEPGEYLITKEEMGTRYVQIIFRTLVNAISSEDNKKVSAIQDEIIVKQKSSGKFEIPMWDNVSLDRTRSIILNFVKDIPNSKKMFGDKNEIDVILHLIGTAAGYGGLSDKNAIYLNVYPKNNDGITPYVLNVKKEVPVDAFWSISVYNKKGYFEKNVFNSYTLNNLTAKKNKDESITIYLGGNPKQVNFIPITPGWSYNIRLYRPRLEVLDGTWSFPKAEPLNLIRNLDKK